MSSSVCSYTRPRVVHILESLKAGGAETLVRNLAAGFVQSEFELQIISIYDDLLSESERASLAAPSISIGRRRRSDFSFFPKLVATLRELKPEIVHCHVSAGKYAGRAAAILASVPAIVFTEHGGDRRDFLRTTINRVLHSYTTRFVTFTDSYRLQLSRIERIPLQQISVIPNGVAAPPVVDKFEIRQSIGIPINAFVLYLSARLTEQKNQMLAIRAFAEVAQVHDGWSLVVAGTGPLDKSLRDEASKIAKGRVRFLGYRDDAAALCRAMDVFIMSSNWEMMPLALGEAMRAGLPVVSTPWTGVENFLIDGVTVSFPVVFRCRNLSAR